MSDGTVYLIHFDEPIAHSQHYLGWTAAPVAIDRVQQHIDGLGNPLVRAVTARGIGVELVRSWSGSPLLEKKLKAWKNSRKLCPICKEGVLRRERVQERARRERRDRLCRL